ncbi:MAG: dienelactone hydrolase family protein [Sneathiella sp.]|nr:dienelactone hydrolase family protein [Sneathiella sp.]
MLLLKNGPENAPIKLILAHGAGAPMDSPFMVHFAEKLGAMGIAVVRFEFPYMQKRRDEGVKKPPDRQPKLLECWREVIEQEQASGQLLVIGGKSMGGRMASLIADEVGVDGLVCLGYPFYAPGKMDKPRIEHLADLQCPTLVVQGERDSMGSKENVSGYSLSSAINLAWLDDGDHSFKPRKKSGLTKEENWDEGVELTAQFLKDLQ